MSGKADKGEQFMKFGQIIRIHGHIAISKQGNQGKQKRGMIAVKGFTDLDARYVPFENFKNCQFYRETLFQVLPKGSFDASDTLEAKRKQEQAYSQLINQRMGMAIKFGEDIVFKHVDSEAYLSGSVRCSDGGLGAFKVQLSNQLSNNLVFRLYPFRSFQKQGDKIKLQSPLRIKNISNRCYVSTQQNKSKNSIKYSIVTTYSQSFTWLIHLHQGHQTLQDKQKIRTHDILFLTHTKNQGYLCLVGQQKKKKPCIKLPLQDTGYPCYTCLWEIQKWAIPEIAPYPDSNLGTQGTYSLRDVLTGDYLEVFKLQQLEMTHISNTVSASIDSKEISIKSAKGGLTLPTQYMKNKGLIKICGPKALSKFQGQLDAGQLIQSRPQDFDYRQVSPYQINAAKYTDIESQHGFRIQKIDEDSKRQVLFVLSTYQVLNQFAQDLQKPTPQFQGQMNFKRLEMIDNTLRKLIAFIKNCALDDIEEDILPERKKQFIAQDLQICPILFRMLQQMGIKILEEIYKKEKNQNQIFKQVFNRAYYLILQIIKNNPMTKLYVCESWLSIILDHAIQNQQQTVHQTLNEILQSNQLVVSKFLKANGNHLVYRIINIFTLKPAHQKFLNIFRASCMSNDAPIVKNQNLILDIFFKKLDEVAKFKFIKNVRIDTLAYNSQSMDQKGTYEQDKKIYLRCCISKDHQRTRSLKNFFEESSRLDLSQTSNYFTAYLNLLADICYGRNTDAKKYVEQILVPVRSKPVPNAPPLTALDTLIGILQDQQIKQVKGSTNLLRAVLRLINYAFVQSADQNPVLRINRYRNLNNMVKVRYEVDPKFKNVMSFIRQRLKNFQSFYNFGQSRDNTLSKKEKQIISIQEKQFLLTTLVLLRSTLIIGYWSVEEQQKYLIPLLLKVLKNNKTDILHSKDEEIDSSDKLKAEFQKFKEEASRYTPSIESIVQCKALACQLIEIIFDFRHDDLVTKCAKVYNELFEKTQAIRQSTVLMDRSSASMRLVDPKTKKLKNQFYDVKVWQQYLQGIFTEGTQPEQQPTLDKSKLIVKSQDNDQLQGKAIQRIIPLMVEMSIHRNPHLFFRSLTILKRHFQFRFDIFKLFLNLSIYDQRNGSQLATKIQQRRNVLNKLQQQNLLYIYEPGVYDQIMKFLVWLSEALKVDTNILIQPNFNNFKTIFCHFTERSQLNKFHQRLIKNKDLHPVLLKFIGLSRQKISTFSQDARQVLKYIYRFLTLLVRSFKQAKIEVLPLLDKIKSHAKQQCQILKHRQARSSVLDLISIQKRDDCQAIQLLYQLFSHNKKILYNESYMQQTSAQFCSYANQVSIYQYYKSHLLNFFRSFIYYNDKHIKVNQSRILAKLQDSKKTHIYYREDPYQQDSLSQHLINDLVKQWQQDNKQIIDLVRPGSPSNLAQGQLYPVIISPRLTYFITLFNLFANLVQGQHTVNIGKCQQVHSYDMLMGILKCGSICYPLKTHLRNYINQLYYSTGVQQDLCQPIIQKQIPLIIEDLNKIIVIICKRVEGHYYIAHPIRYKYYETYFYLYIQQIVFTLNYLFHDENFTKSITAQLSKNYSRGYYYLHYYIIRIYQRLRWIVNHFYQYRYLRNFINKVTNRIKKDYLQKFREVAFRIFDRNQENLHNFDNQSDLTIVKPKTQINQVRVDALNRRSKNLLHKLIKGQIGNYFTEKRRQKDNNFPLTFVLPYQDQSEAHDPTQKKHRQDQLNKLAQKLKILLFAQQDAYAKKDYHHRKLIKLKQSLMESEEFIEFMVMYQENECAEMYDIDKHKRRHRNHEEVFVSFTEYIKIFVKVNTEKPQSITNDLKIFFFKVLLQYIKSFKRDNKLRPLQLWTEDDWIGHEQDIKKNQIFLKESNVAELFIQSLKNSDDIHLFSSIMHFGIAFVLRGNTQCQDSILQKLYQDRKNEVFLKLQKQITRLGKKITSRIAQQTARKIPTKQQFVVESLDLYDFYDSKLNVMKKMVTMQTYLKDQTEEDETDRQVFTRTFRFLQFLCQNNNTKAKKFVRKQVDSQGQRNSYTFNMINITTFQIRRLFKVMNRQASRLIMPLIDFLNEVVTIPVVQNQISLCQTTFFEDLCYMASFFNSDTNLKERGLDTQQHNQQLFRIYHKCIEIILNVLQGNHNGMIRQLTIKLDVSFLLTVIERNLKKLKINTVADFQSLLYDQDRQRKQVPTQIQIAMKVMIVIEKLLVSERADIIEEKMKACIAGFKQGEKQKFQQLLQALKRQLNRIEIISSQGKQSIYFPNHPILTKLSPTTRDRIMLQVSRTTQRQKIRSLFAFKDQVIAEINHNFQIQKKKFLGISFQPSKIQKLQTWAFQLSHLINLIWFMTVDVVIQYYEVNYYTNATLSTVLMVLDVIQLVIAVTYLISYTKCKYKLAEFRANQSLKKSREEKSTNLISTAMTMAHQGTLNENQQQARSKKPLTTITAILLTIWTAILTKITRSSLVIILKYDQKFTYVLMYVVASSLGTFYYQGLFLLYIIFFFMQNDTLSNVFNAIVYNLKQLLSVSLLGVVFVYVFSLIFYSTYSLQTMKGKPQDQVCEGVLSCIMDLYVSGAIGGSVSSFQLFRFFTDMTWFVFFGLLFGNIVSGIMIETFAELRAKRQKMYDDKKNMCYICGEDRGNLQKNNEDFDQHIKTKHFLWNYIFYMYCLSLKDKNNFSGLEYEIHDCISSSQGQQEYIKWVPFQSQGQEQHGQKIAELSHKLQDLNHESQQRIVGMQKMMMQAINTDTAEADMDDQ